MKHHKDLYRRARRQKRERLAVARLVMPLIWERLAERGVPENRRPVEGPWL